MHQYFSFRAHVIFIAHRHIVQKNSKKNAAFINMLTSCEQAENFIYSLADMKQQATAKGKKFPPKKSDSPLLNFTVEQHDLNEFSDEVHEYVKQLDMRYILNQKATTNRETVLSWNNVDVFVARFILENPIRVNGISPKLNFFSTTNPLATFFQHNNIDPTQPGWGVLSIINQLPSIYSSVDPIWYRGLGGLFHNAFTLEKFAIVATDSDDTFSNQYALLVDKNNRQWHTWIPEQQKNLKIKRTIDAKNNATLHAQSSLQKMKVM